MTEYIKQLPDDYLAGSHRKLRYPLDGCVWQKEELNPSLRTDWLYRHEKQ